MESKKQLSDERGYFRILDFMGFDYSQLDDAEYQKLRIASQYAEVPPLDELSEINQQIQLLVDKLKIKTPDMADFARLINQKLDILLQHSDLSSRLALIETIPRKHIDISATGMAFPATQSLDVDTVVRVDLVLNAGGQHLKVLAKVVGCEADTEWLSDGDPSLTHIVRVRFIDMSENISEFLIQYLVKRQSALLKKHRKG